MWGLRFRIEGLGSGESVSRLCKGLRLITRFVTVMLWFAACGVTQ